MRLFSRRAGVARRRPESSLKVRVKIAIFKFEQIYAKLPDFILRFGHSRFLRSIKTIYRLEEYFVMIIRNEQIKVFENIAEDNFIDDLVAKVRETHGEQVADFDDDELRRLVETGGGRARGHGLEGEEAIGVFVGWMFEFAPNFDEQENIKKMLADERLAPDDRIELVAEAATEKDWAEAEAAYDETAWDERK
jgi:hypothetical protein